jgi:3-phenylpropionate/trans-cinnamate dioxygenase ferredoxin reductase subunit
VPRGYETTVIRPPKSPEGFIVFYVKGNRVIAVDCVNAIAEFNVTRRLVSERIEIDPVALADPTIDLKSLVMPKGG